MSPLLIRDKCMSVEILLVTHDYKKAIIGPFQFLVVCLLVSEFLLVCWMIFVKPEYNERIVIGAFSITVLISILAIFCIIYKIKKDAEDFKKH